MPHTIPPFPEVTYKGFIRQPGNLSRARAAQVKPIHNQLRADLSHHPEQEQQLVCRAFQQLYDVHWGFYQHGGAAYNPAVECELGEKVFALARECKWLPEAARISDPAWRGWVTQLIAGRVKWMGFEDCSQPDPYVFVPFPIEMAGAEKLARPDEEPVTIARPRAKRQTGSARQAADSRKAFVTPRRIKKGWSIFEWATASNVDFHTADDYLKGRTRPYPSTRKKLAESLGVRPEELPQ
jgi:hypothetical protein